MKTTWTLTKTDSNGRTVDAGEYTTEGRAQVAMSLLSSLPGVVAVTLYQDGEMVAGWVA